MSKTMRTILIISGVLLAVFLILALVFSGKSTGLMFALLALIVGALVLWIVINTLRGSITRKKPLPKIEKYQPEVAKEEADKAWDMPTSSACPIEPVRPEPRNEPQPKNPAGGSTTSAQHAENKEPAKNTPLPVTSPYIGHIETRVFHVPSCRVLPAEKNRVYLKSREDAVGGGYSPCSFCNP